MFGYENDDCSERNLGRTCCKHWPTSEIFKVSRSTNEISVSTSKPTCEMNIVFREIDENQLTTINIAWKSK